MQRRAATSRRGELRGSVQAGARAYREVGAVARCRAEEGVVEESEGAEEAVSAAVRAAVEVVWVGGVAAVAARCQAADAEAPVGFPRPASAEAAARRRRACAPRWRWLSSGPR